MEGRESRVDGLMDSGSAVTRAMQHDRLIHRSVTGLTPLSTAQCLEPGRLFGFFNFMGFRREEY
jgi:hypothetical protein